MSNKVIVVGLDGATFDLIRPWIGQGKLPTMARLVTEGASGDLRVQWPPGTVPNWPSFMTGVNTGKHGIYFWLKKVGDKFAVVNSTFLKQKPLWNIIGDFGKRSIVINVPITYPPTPLDGVIITDGILTPANASIFTYPSSLREEIEQNLGEPYRLYPEVAHQDGKERAFLDCLKETENVRFRTLQYLKDSYPWELIVVVFSATDLVQHACWKFIDSSHPQYDAKSSQKFGDSILRVYQQMDGFLKTLLEQMEQETRLVIMSDHGSGPLYLRMHSSVWLLHEGYLALRRSPLTALKYLLFRSGITVENAYRVARMLGLGHLKKRIAPRLNPDNFLRKWFLSFNDVDWSRTRAYAQGGGIYINVRGRNDQGSVSPGKEYETLRDELIAKLSQITIPGTTERFFPGICKKEDLYFGEEMDAIPDILLINKPGYEDTGDFEFFSNKIYYGVTSISGTHRDNGVFILWGKGIKKGLQLDSPSILDIAPTVFCLLGLPVPDYMDGRILQEAIESPDFFSQVDADSADGTEKHRQTENDYSSEEEQEIIERLTNLGYL